MYKRMLGALALAGLVFSLAPSLSSAAVTVTAVPVPLVVDPILVKASSQPVGVFSFSVTSDAGEGLSGVSVTVNKANASTTVAGGDLSSLALYKDEGDGSFNPTADSLVGSQPTVAVGSATQIVPSTTTPVSGKFFVAFSTSGSWSDASPADSINLSFDANGILASTGTVVSVATTTANITADTTGPNLVSVMAKNTGGTDAKEAGDSVEMLFSESTNKPVITSSNINSFISVNNSHFFLDAAGNLGAASWNAAGNVLTITLSGTSTPTSTLPSIAVGDSVAVVSNSNFTDLAGNLVSGTQGLVGSFGGSVQDDGSDEEVKGNCANSIVNGRLYKISGSDTVYLAAACRLKPFRGAAVFRARGHKFNENNIRVLSSLPGNVSTSDKPVLPAAGTLVKGSDKTVWFVTKEGKKRGFVSEKQFKNLGFSYGILNQIADTDLVLIPQDLPIEEGEAHPDGALVKCGNSPAIFQVIGSKKFPFANAQAFQSKGHAFSHVLNVDCGRFAYISGAPIVE